MKETTNAMRKTAPNAPASSAKNSATHLTVVSTDVKKAETRSCIPEVRAGIRQQVKMLRSIGKGVFFLGVFCEIVMCICIIPWQEQFGLYAGFTACICGLAIALVALFLQGCIWFATGEISDELKKLNEVV